MKGRGVLKLTTVAFCVITTIAHGLLTLAQTVVGWYWRYETFVQLKGM